MKRANILSAIVSAALLSVSFFSCQKDLDTLGPDGQPLIILDQVEVNEKEAKIKGYLNSGNSKIDEIACKFQHDTEPIVILTDPEDGSFEFTIAPVYTDFQYRLSATASYEGNTISSNTQSFRGEAYALLDEMEFKKIEPSVARAGDKVTITGDNFIPGVPVKVFVSGSEAKVTKKTLTSIEFIVPNNLSGYRVRIIIKREGSTDEINTILSIMH